MPALVLFKRRWKLGSDDLVIPAAILAAIHLIWTTILAYMLVVSENSPSDSSHWTTSLRWFVIGLMAIFPASLVLEVAIAVFSGRGGPLKTNMRSSVSTLLYLRLGLLGVELFWEILSMVRLFLSGDNKPSSMVLSIIGGFLLFNWLVTFTVIGQFGKAPPLRDNLKCSGVNPSCSFHPLSGDEVSSEKAAGKISMGGDGSGIYSSINEALCRGGAMSNSLIGQTLANNNDGDRTACGDRRFYGSHEICCFSVPSKRNSYSELERVISFTLSDLDLVQSDIIAGLVLFKRSQRSMQDMTIAEPSNEVYQFLSGTPITSTTRFLGFKSQGSVEFYSRVVRFMKYPLATHRLMRSTVFKKFRSLRGHSDGDAMKRCTCCQKSRVKNPKRLNSDRIQTLQSEPVEKELANLIGQKQFELLHCSLLNADLDGMSFLVGLDHEFKAVVVCVWSTICLKDAFVKMCSIKATSQCVIVRPDWFVSEYFAMLADKIYSRLRNDNLLLQALSRDQLSGTECYELIVTGQSMAGGVACVLAVLLKQFYHNLHCFAYAPPNSIFNAACVRETQSFITSIVVGKDVMPRLSCNQIEAFRQSLVSCLRSCNSHKLRILCSQRPSACCPDHQSPSTAQTTMEHLGREGGLFNKSTGLYLPGKVVHIVRSRPKISCSNRMSQCKRHSVFQAVWARNEDFKNILVSRKMISDHCPFLIMDALEKVLTHISPAKPVRKGASGKRGHHRPMISANSSHNETTLTSQNTVSDFSTSEQLIESTYAPATLSMGPTEVPHPSVQEFFNQSMTLTGNVSEPHLGLEIPGPYERINNQTFPKVKMRSSRPSEFASRVIRIMPQQLSSNGGPSGQHTEGFYNIINVPNHFASMTSDSGVSNPAKIRTTATNHFLAGDQSNKRQPILIDNWTGAFAPLASPEALSESSSLASCGEQSSSGYPVGFVAGLPGHRGDSIKRLSSGAAYQRLVARIDPIRQSPLGPIHPFSGGWIDSGSADTASSHKDLPQRIKKSSLTSKSNTGSLRSRSTNQEQGSVKGDEEQAKDLRDFSTFLSHDPHSKESYYAEIGEPSDCPSNHVAAPKSDSLYDLIMDASPPVEKQPQWEEPEGRAKADSDLMVFSPPSSGEHLRAKAATIFLSTADDRIHKDSIAQKEQQMSQQFESIALPVTTGSLFEHEPIYSKVIPRPERKYENPENVSKDVSSPAKSDLYLEPRRCLPEEKDVVVNNNTFFHDSDDDYEEAQEQFIYDLVIGHYSCAGRGYPHGFIESYSKTTHLSVAEEVAEPPPNIF